MFAVGTLVTAVLLIAVMTLAVSYAVVRRESEAKELALQEKSQALGEKVTAAGVKRGGTRGGTVSGRPRETECDDGRRAFSSSPARFTWHK